MKQNLGKEKYIVIINNTYLRPSIYAKYSFRNFFTRLRIAWMEPVQKKYKEKLVYILKDLFHIFAQDNNNESKRRNSV